MSTAQDHQMMLRLNCYETIGISLWDSKSI